MFKVALYLLIAVILAIFLLPFVYTISPYQLDPTKILQAPSFEHLFGTDRLGRDMFARVLNGGQTSLIIGFLAASISSIVGLFIGINAGYFKGYYWLYGSNFAHESWRYRRGTLPKPRT